MASLCLQCHCQPSGAETIVTYFDCIYLMEACRQTCHRLTVSAWNEQADHVLSCLPTFPTDPSWGLGLPTYAALCFSNFQFSISTHQHASQLAPRFGDNCPFFWFLVLQLLLVGAPTSLLPPTKLRRHQPYTASQSKPPCLAYGISRQCVCVWMVRANGIWADGMPKDDDKKRQAIVACKSMQINPMI